jgi:hypothetical protein
MASATSFGSWRQRPAPVMAVLGLVSGLLSATVAYDHGLLWLKPLGALFFLDSGPVPIGLLFGAAVALGLWISSGNAWALLVVPVTTMYAWSAAIQVALRLQRTVDDDPHLIAASLAAGAVGAGLTHLGCAVVAPALRQPQSLAIACLVGAVAGLLLFAGQRQLLDERLLFIVWQPAVVLALGLKLARSCAGG